jgi:hypothetical protein
MKSPAVSGSMSTASPAAAARLMRDSSLSDPPHFRFRCQRGRSYAGGRFQMDGAGRRHGLEAVDHKRHEVLSPASAAGRGLRRPIRFTQPVIHHTRTGTAKCAQIYRFD